DLRGLIVGNADSPMYANPDGPDIYIAGGRSGNIYDFEYQGGDITDPENYLLDTLWSAPDYGNPTSWFRPSKVVTGYFDDDSLGDILIASMDYDNFYAPHLVWIEHDYEEVISIDDEDNAVMPENIEISAIYPNPFNPTTRIEYKLPISENVQISVFNVNGKMVKQLAKGYQNNGLHSIRWNAKNDLGQPVPSGVYFITIQSEHNLISQKLLLIK
ncbi:MAG TPA: T9SS type A sorting domain-containing protein, partial [Candidatus Marinimicrobia bacterium]|nr:T9SS type A sorting domain-containing protein [Candidatus Neomarinimicrobiota bacterium]